MNLRDTLQLPDPSFSIPMKADLSIREPEILASWDEQGIYHAIQEAHATDPVFVLHDGPPYTNSPIHIGTALNKMLKDFVVKSRAMMGLRAPYVPGFDNHGLPIEMSVVKKFFEQIKAEIKESGSSALAEELGVSLPPSENAVGAALKQPEHVNKLRRACREHAAHYIGVQTEQFKRLGVFGLWEKPYATMDYRYEAEIIRVFKRLVEQGFVYKGLRPTLWSPTSRTALADTEIVYQNHVSKAIYVRFPLLEDANGWSHDLKNVYTMIWTTTPWTIPANLAVAFHPNFEYVIARSGEDHYLVLKDLNEKVRDAIGATDWTVVRELLGSSFEGSKFKHPIFDRPSIAVMAEYVTTEDGTGVVHTAPGHGRDDFFTGLKYDLPILCPVDERGVLTEEAGEFAGTYYKACDKNVVARLEELGALLSVSDYEHSYPHAERDGQPVIFRATEQWFVGIDRNDLRNEMLRRIAYKPHSEVENGEPGVTWLPANGFNRIESMVRNRPDWCISRQRPWGVGIPVVYGAKSGVPVLDPSVIESIAKKVQEEGSDVWFAQPAEYFLPSGFTHPETGETDFRKETDVLDVWFDSGCTSLCVLEGNVEPAWKDRWPADLYLEGSDQHRGWFNSSLIISTAVRGEPPYKTVLTHGFVNTESGDKMSKRSGNALDPVDVCNRYGADVLRYWCASVDWKNDAPCGESLLKQFGDVYRDVRNRLRFLLGNLFDYPNSAEGEPLPTTDGVTFHWRLEIPDQVENRNTWAHDHELLPIDRWMIEQTDLLVRQCVDSYREYDFGAVINAVHNFCESELSAVYLDAIKDRMYCDGKDWPSRRSGQIACHYALMRITKLIAPILCFTAEEVWAKIPGKPEHEPKSVHMAVFEVPSDSRLEQIQGSQLQADFAALLSIRNDVFAQFEIWKGGQDVKDSQDVIVTFGVTGSHREALDRWKDDLAVFFKMSEVRIEDGDTPIRFEISPYEKCDRSRLRRADVQVVNEMKLTARDRMAVGLA